MADVRGLSSNRNPRVGLAGGNAPTRMVGLNVETSNQLLTTLQEWNVELQAHLVVP